MSSPHKTPQLLAGVWSATPTAFTEKLKVDVSSTKRMVEHHLKLGVKGLFLAGTCGEGPWMPESEKRVLTQTVAQQAKGRLSVAVQVSDNSAERVVDNIRRAREDGADIAIIAPPYFLLNATPQNILRFYQRAIRESSLPVGLYHIVRTGSVNVPEAILRKILEEKNLVLVKDSSAVPDHRRIIVAAKRKRPELVLLDGDEFACVDYIEAGYDGLLLGGAILSAHLGSMLLDAAALGDWDEARSIERRMHQILYAVYGGKLIHCWLSGLKWSLVQMGVFQTWSNFLNYPLTPSCVQAICRVLERHADLLMPGNPEALRENIKKEARKSKAW